MQNSYFDGTLSQLILYRILGIIITTVTLGIAYPWAVTMVYSWEIKHTVVEGRRLAFTGSATGLFAHWIKWLLLTIVTLGIYSFWIQIKIRQWKAKHTIFAY